MWLGVDAVTTVLVLGGVRSGKSSYAERLLDGRPHVTYLAPGAVPDPADTEWLARIAAHRARRPAHWRTVEGGDVPAAVAAVQPGQAVLLDCLGTWVTRLVDEAGAWDDSGDGGAQARAAVEAQAARLAAALAGCAGDAVVVSNEVGLGVVPPSASGRLFRDLLGRLNAGVAEACDHLAYVVAGRVLDLTGVPRFADAPTFGLGATPRAEAGQRPAATPVANAANPVANPDGGLDEIGPDGLDLWEDAGLTWRE